MNLKNTFFGVGGTHSQTNIFGISPEILAAIVKQHGEHSDLQKKEIDRLQSALELTTGQIRAALEILGEANIPSEGIAAKLVEIAGRFKILQAMVSTDPTDSPKIIELKIEAQRAIGSGKLARADELWAQIETEQRISFDRVAANIAETLAKRGEIAMTRLRYTEAAGHFANAAAILPIGDPHEGMRAGFLELESGAWYIHGYEFGDIVALRLAIERQRHLITLLSRKRVPLDWAKAQNAVGIALSRLGEHENETTSLDAAAAAYREALKERTRVRVPLDWAMTQNNLGNVLSKLGERESSTARLDEAVAAYREALKERTQERVPLDWAMTQNNLGTALSSLGARESGTARLDEAVAAYREALKEYTQERVPLQWAGTQNNLTECMDLLNTRRKM